MGVVIPFPVRERQPQVEIFERLDEWHASVDDADDAIELGERFPTKIEALAYARGLAAVTGWQVVDYDQPKGRAA